MRSTQAQKHLARFQILTATLNTEGATGAIAAALHKQGSELQRMLTGPDITYSRKHPSVDNAPRPPPKNFTDFEKERSVTPSNPQGPKSTFVPGSQKETPPFRAATEEEEREHDERGQRQRVAYLENRVTTLENQVEDLTELVTNPKGGTTAQNEMATFVVTFVRLAVIDGYMTHEHALLAIAKQLGLIDVTTKLAQQPKKRKTPAAPVAAADDDEEEDDAPPAPLPSKPAPAPSKPAPVDDAKPPRDYAKGGRPGPPDEWPGRAKFLARLKRSGISQGAVSTEAGLNQSSVSRYLRGHATTAENAKKLEEALAKLMG